MARALRSILPAALAAALACATAHADGPDRERAQIQQLQQQLQRVQADNAALQRKQGELQGQADKADQLEKESTKTGKDLEHARADAAAKGREIERLRAELDALREQTNTQVDQWRKALDERDSALVAAAGGRRDAEAQIALLTARLKAQTGRADVCEVRHVSAMKLAGEVIDRYEQNRLRLCEPITGIWKLRDETEVQKMRDRLYEARLDVSVPVPAEPAAGNPGAAPVAPAAVAPTEATPGSAAGDAPAAAAAR